MKRIRYCTRCLYPETKPDLWFDEDGVCSACLAFDSRQDVDWAARKQEFLGAVERYRSKDGTNYDCIVPVSGGKDSHYQVLRILELGMNPLCVTATTCALSELGRRNIENIKGLGVDYIEVTTNPLVRRRINKLALYQIGEISWPEHLTIFTIPVRIAVKMNVPLIIWGENPQHEYGGPASAQESAILNRRWLEEFGGLLGLRVSDLVGQTGIERRHLIQFTYPSDEELKQAGITGLFLGHYFPWDGYANSLYAQAHGFETYPRAVEGNIVNYEDLDNFQLGIHDYFKFLKYGFGRATDLASNHIRRGRMSRDDGLKVVRMRDGIFKKTYLGRSIRDILAEIDVDMDDFERICDGYTNKRLFVCDNNGNLVKDADGRLTKINYDNEDR